MSTTHSNPLSDQQLTILYYVAMGLSNKEIADKLGVTREEVRHNVLKTQHQLGAADRTAAAKWFVKNGLHSMFRTSPFFQSRENSDQKIS